MSRIGNKPIPILEGVEVKIQGNQIQVRGKKGELKREIHPEIKVEVENNTILVKRSSELRFYKSLHGLTRSLIANMVIGVSEGFEKTLELVGVGYRAIKKGESIELSLGYSKPVIFQKPVGIEFDVPSQNKIIISGIDNEKVGQTAADIRKIRKVEPYKGKGIRYTDEYVRRKVGKAGIK